MPDRTVVMRMSHDTPGFSKKVKVPVHDQGRVGDWPEICLGWRCESDWDWPKNLQTDWTELFLVKNTVQLCDFPFGGLRSLWMDPLIVTSAWREVRKQCSGGLRVHRSSVCMNWIEDRIWILFVVFFSEFSTDSPATPTLHCHAVTCRLNEYNHFHFNVSPILSHYPLTNSKFNVSLFAHKSSTSYSPRWTRCSQCLALNQQSC